MAQQIPHTSEEPIGWNLGDLSQLKAAKKRKCLLFVLVANKINIVPASQQRAHKQIFLSSTI